MATKKEKPAASATDPALEAKVDQMMDPARPAIEPKLPSSATPPPIDVFKELRSAPPLSSDLKKKVGTVRVNTNDGKAATADATKLSSEDALVSSQTTSDEVPAANLDDPLSDAAVDEITADEGDTVLAAEDAERDTGGGIPPPRRKGHRGFGWLHKKSLVILLVIGLLLIVAFAVPYSRYKILGLFLKEQESVQVLDQTSSQPVTGAVVTIDGQTSKTDAAGNALLHIPVGLRILTVSKQYYASVTEKTFVGLRGAHHLTIKLTATGRQVPIKIINALSGQPIVNATITVLDTNAKTNQNGQATIVLPTRVDSYTATITASGYNQLSNAIAVTNQQVSANTFHLVPTGKIYFLSNSSGTIDVVSTNLDASDRQTVLAGTGNETLQTTQLSNSSDWRYLMLMATRSSAANTNGLFLINTADNNALSTVAQGNYTFTPIGWSGHYFVYEEQNNNVGSYQSGAYLLKSYDAETGKSITLDQTAGSGSQFDSISQTFSSYNLLGTTLIYAKLWQGDNMLYTSGNVSSINTISVTGTDQSQLQQFPMSVNGNNPLSIQSEVVGYKKLDFEIYNGNGTQQYYSYANGAVSAANLSATTYQAAATNYTPGVLSPSGSVAAFPAQRDGQLVIETGAPDADPSSQITQVSLSSDYSFVGWYTDQYLLVSYKSSTLYILPISSKGNTPASELTEISHYLNTYYYY